MRDHIKIQRFRVKAVTENMRWSRDGDELMTKRVRESLMMMIEQTCGS